MFVPQSVRRIEKTVLDEYHKHCGLMRRPHDLSIGHLLKVYGDVVRDFERSKGTDAVFYRNRFIVNSLAHGVAHCFRWLNEAAEPQVLLPKASWQTLDQEAVEFLTWGAKYALLANGRNRPSTH